MSVPEAAKELGLSEQRVRVLISRGQLRAEKVAGRWLVDSVDLDRRKVHEGERGRPLSPQNAWGYLYLLSGNRPEWLTPSAQYRLTQRLHDELPHPRALDRRSKAHRYHVHPGLMKRLDSDNRLVRTGISAAQDYGIGIVGRGELEAYVKAEHVESIIREYKLSEREPANVLLREVPELWPFGDVRAAPPGVVAWDLFVSDDERSRRAGGDALRRLKRERAEKGVSVEDHRTQSNDSIESVVRGTDVQRAADLRVESLPASELLTIGNAYGIEGISVFGSRSRGDNRPDSDLDLLVRVRPGTSLISLIKFEDAVETLLGVHVDVVTLEGLSRRVRDSVLREARPLYAA